MNKKMFTVAMLLTFGLLMISLIMFARGEFAKKDVVDSCNAHWREQWAERYGDATLPENYIFPNLTIVNKNES